MNINILIILVFILNQSCRSNKCPNMAELKSPNSNIPYLKCNETGLVIVTDMNGKIVCSYYDKTSK